MTTLHRTLRSQFERIIVEARDVAERAAGAAIEQLAVGEPAYYPHMNDEQKQLRRQLRARGRAMGDRRNPDTEKQETDYLVQETAYQHWHRMLFARFLAENDLLMHPDGISVTLEECNELAREHGMANGWEVAESYAARMLPQIFRPDDPVLRIHLAPEHEQALEKLIDQLPAEIFYADDSLGWTYQFWQSKRKDEVNASGDKIGADELPAVTQLFTEDYMVQFLLDNTLGAWWAGKYLENHPEIAEDTSLSEEELRRIVAPNGCSFDYLRFLPAGADKGSDQEILDHNIPAAGTFEGWPRYAKDIRALDPCCGSGHFTVAKLHKLVPMRMQEEGLSAREACDAVLRENLYGLEIDKRCTQIAAFALALAAWKYSGSGGYRELPQFNIACSGLPVTASKDEWLKLAGKDEKLLNGMDKLYDLFKEAPTLGSLIDPSIVQKDLLTAGFDELKVKLSQALSKEQSDETRETEVTALGIARAAELLSGRYHLVATNVPYLLRRKQDQNMQTHCDENYPLAISDIACCFLERIKTFVAKRGNYSAVLPLNWTFQKTGEKLRTKWLHKQEWLFATRLGTKAFGQISGEVVNVGLFIFCNRNSPSDLSVKLLDTPTNSHHDEKKDSLKADTFRVQSQLAILKNPDARLIFEPMDSGPLLSEYVQSLQGLVTGDDPKFKRSFWEIADKGPNWQFSQESTSTVSLYGGKNVLVDWHEEGYNLARRQGVGAWGKKGVAVNRMTNLCASLYSGDLFSINIAALIPKKINFLPAIWTFCKSPNFCKKIRKLDQKVNVTNATLAKVPFDLKYWQKVAEQKYPNGLPEPYSDDPTQWTFHGHPCGSVIWNEKKKWTALGKLRTDKAVLQAAVARLLGYRWPAEFDPEMELAEESRKLVEACDNLLPLADRDGIVCLQGLQNQLSADERLRKMLAAAYGDEWSLSKEAELIAACGSKAKNLEEWLYNNFFKQHCKMFHNRPFIWHIWDGIRTGGFSALVNYHKLDRKLLERLTYTYLGDWIKWQEYEVEQGAPGAEGRLEAAKRLQVELQRILEGEKPYDIFVRWKPLHQQPIGWEPDINDGVRMNIRPFMTAEDMRYKYAGVLSFKPNINWTKDKGKEPHRPKEDYPWFWDGDDFTANRVNDVHLSIEKKRKSKEGELRGL